ncbi:hypothetical protein DUNSADRAFT_7366 [Dunaliella salina]|uniref:Uncharacterized protein n=1 Tax=Dunaliella salina TaxID=3046 RepID=A0ABQ7H6A6_DUNSA|nr:hypothetical protein DUNSADRAFT_7366 [Dunaliella salina]|eukprot:KAF5842382.1 hypothetical protein DUNSADRAFT_7366 [Dunaliella salina]
MSASGDGWRSLTPLSIIIPPASPRPDDAPPTPGTAAAVVAEAALQITSERPEQGSTRLSKGRGRFKRGRAVNLAGGGPDIRTRAPTKLGKKLQAARASFHHEHVMRSKEQGGRLQFLFARSPSKAPLGGAGPFDLLPRSVSQMPDRDSTGPEPPAPVVPPASLSLSMLPTATDQWKADKTLYYSPVSCTSSMAPHKFPATLREGMLLYFRPMQKEQVLESVAHTNARGGEQAAANAETFQASLHAEHSSRPSARAVELFRLAGDPEALLAAEDKLSVWVTNLARKAGVHAGAIWALLEAGNKASRTAQQDSSSAQEQGLSEGQQQLLQCGSIRGCNPGSPRQKHHKLRRSKSSLLLEAALRRDPVADFNGYITPGASTYVTGLQAKPHIRGQSLIKEGLDTAQHLRSTQKGKAILDPLLPKELPHRGTSAHASREAAMQDAICNMEEVFRFGPRQRTARRLSHMASASHKEINNGVTMDPGDKNPPEPPGAQGSCHTDAPSAGTMGRYEGSSPAGAGPANTRQHLHQAIAEHLYQQGIIAGDHHHHQQQQQQQQALVSQHLSQQRQHHPHPLSKSLDAPRDPHTLMFNTFLDRDAAGVAAQPLTLPPSYVSQGVASQAPVRKSLGPPLQTSPALQKPALQHAPMAAGGPALAGSVAAPEAGGVPVPQASRGHALLSQANHILHLPATGLPELAGSQATQPHNTHSPSAEPLIPGHDHQDESASKDSLGFQSLSLVESTTDEVPETKARAPNGHSVGPLPPNSMLKASSAPSAPSNEDEDSAAPHPRPRSANKIAERPLLTVCKPSAQHTQSAKKPGHKEAPTGARPQQPPPPPPPPPSPPTNFQALRQSLQARTQAPHLQKAQPAQDGDISIPSNQVQQQYPVQLLQQPEQQYLTASFHASPGGVMQSEHSPAAKSTSQSDQAEVAPAVPTTADQQLDKLRSLAGSRGSLGEAQCESRGSPAGGDSGQEEGEGHGSQSALGSKGSYQGPSKPSAGGHSTSTSGRRRVGPKMLDHKMRPLRMVNPAPPLLVFSSGLADSYKMITQVNEARQVKHRIISAEKQLTPLALRRLQRNGIS